MDRQLPTFDFLVVIEGTDGSGKKTHSTALRQWMSDNNAAATKRRDPDLYAAENDVMLLDFPDYNSMTGKLVKHMLDGHYGDDASKLNAYFTSPMYSLDRYAYLKKLYDEHNYSIPVGICNRYTISNLIHQGSRLSNSELIQYWAWLKSFEHDKLGIPKPDLTIYLDIPAHVAHALVVERAIANDIPLDINEQKEFMERVENNVQRIRDMAGWHTVECYNYAKQQLRSIDAIQKDIQAVVTAAIVEKMQSKLGFDPATGHIAHSLYDFIPYKE